MELSVNPRDYITDRIPHFSKPKVCGSFSVGSTRNYLDDNSRLSFLRGIPSKLETEYDLNLDASRTINRIKKDERLEFLCHYLRDHQKPINVFDKSNISLRDVPFINYRGFLREISALPYQFSEPCRISVCLFRGAIYMHTLDNPQKKHRRENPTEWEEKCSAWGYKFEHFLLSTESDAEPDLNTPLNESEEFSCVFASKLRDHRLVYGAEMDGLLCGKSDKISKEDLTADDLTKYKFVELKTSKQITERKHDVSFRRFKVLAWWLQSFFAGVETILCGYRNDAGIVKELETFNVYDLPKSGRQYWNPSVCLNFCSEFLSFVKACLAQEVQRMHGNCLDNVRNLPKIDLLFERDPKRSMRLCAQSGDEEISVIPQWYVDLFPKV